MKKYLIPFILVILIFSSFQDVYAQKKKKKNKADQPQTEEPAFQNLIDSVSYVIGREIGTNLLMVHSNLNIELLVKTIDEAFQGKESLFPQELSDSIMKVFQQQMIDQENMTEKRDAEMTRVAGQKFLEENKLREGVIELPSGLQYEILLKGEGESPTADNEVTVHYKGTLIDGTVFDSSYERNETITFGLNKVIKGWTEGLQLMKPGSKYIFYIPPDLGYGDQAVGPIPAGSTLIFVVELFSFEKK